MNLAEIVVVSIGLSLDVFAVTACEGAMLAEVEKKKLICMSLIFCIWQLAAVLTGNLITRIPVFGDITTGMEKVWDGFSVLIFIGIGIYMLRKAWKNESIFECRRKINYKQVCLLAAVTSLDAFFAGIGFGFLETRIFEVGLVLELVTLLAAAAGVYTGHRLGYEQRTKAYGIGGTILVLAGVDVIIRYLLR